MFMGLRISVSLSQDTEKSWGDTENRSLLWGEEMAKIFGTSGEGAPKARAAMTKIRRTFGVLHVGVLLTGHRK